jgi:hypothetical protein
MGSRLTRLAIIALLALAAGVFVARRDAPSGVLTAGGPLVAGLEESINEVDSIRLTSGGNQVIVSLKRGESGWTVAERGGYPADFDKLRRFLLDLARSKRVEAKTSVAENFARLGVEDITATEAKGIKLEIGGLAEPAALIIGQFTGLSGEGTFVRDADGPQAWLASGSLVPDRNVGNWLARDLVDIPSSRIQQIRISQAGSTLVAAKSAPEDEHYTLADVPRGREVSSAFAVDALAGVLSALRLEDVSPAAELAPPETGRIEATYTTFDGLSVAVTAWRQENRNLARFAVALDETVASQAIAEAQSAARLAHEAAVAAIDKDGEADAEVLATPPEAPLAVSDPEKDREQRLDALRKDMEAINRRVEGWTFQLPAHVYANINQTRDGLLKARE